MGKGTPSEERAVLGAVIGAGSTGFVHVGGFGQLSAVVFGTDETLGFKYEQAQDAAGLNVKDVTLGVRADTPVTGTMALANDINVQNHLDADFPYVRLTITSGGATAVGVLEGFAARYGPTSSVFLPKANIVAGTPDSVPTV